MSEARIHRHALAGCTPSPLAHYLKALGILRLVAEQVDRDARGWWQNDVFQLATVLDRDELTSFFLNDYKPTPMVAPWNGGSGFYARDNKSGIEPIVRGVAPRFDAFRAAIATARDVVAHLGEKPCKGTEKNDVIARCRLAWREGSQQWIDAALAIAADGEPVFPALLGTGGNDGRLDFTANLMLRLVSLFDMTDPDGSPYPEAISQLKTALWAEPTSTLENGAIGQFFPGAAGGPNGTSGFSGGVRVNPWDYVLMLEGTILCRTGLSRKCAVQPLPLAAAPFAVRNSSAGYGSSNSTDNSSRGEQWMPLWSPPSTLLDIAAMFREGRNRIQGNSAERGTDMARAVARMGVARGISSFERYGYIERNGLANFAVPLGRFEVSSAKHQKLLDEIAPFVDRLRRLANTKNAPDVFDRVHRACEEAVITCTRSDAPASFLSLLIAAARAEDQMIRYPKFSADNFATPMPILSSQWLKVLCNESGNESGNETCNDTGNETGNETGHDFRLALALASQYGATTSRPCSYSVRAHWVPLDGIFFARSEGGLRVGPEQCAAGLGAEQALIAVVNRRMISAGHGNSGSNNGSNSSNSESKATLPLTLANGSTGARLQDIEAFLQYRVDDNRILAIARGLMSIDFKGYRRSEKKCNCGNRNCVNDDCVNDLVNYNRVNYSDNYSDNSTGDYVHSTTDSNILNNTLNNTLNNSSVANDPSGGLATYGLLRLAMPVHSIRLTPSVEKHVRCNYMLYRRLQAGDLVAAAGHARRQLIAAGLRPQTCLAVGSSRFARRLAASMAFGISRSQFTRLALGVTQPGLGTDEHGLATGAESQSVYLD